MAARYKAVPLSIDNRRWRVFDYAAGKRGKFTGPYYSGPFARARCERRARKLNGG